MMSARPAALPMAMPTMAPVESEADAAAGVVVLVFELEEPTVHAPVQAGHADVAAGNMAACVSIVLVALFQPWKIGQPKR